MSLKKKSKERFSGWLVKRYETEFVVDLPLEETKALLTLLQSDSNFARQVFGGHYPIGMQIEKIGSETYYGYCSGSPKDSITTLTAKLSDLSGCKTLVVLEGQTEATNNLYNVLVLGCLCSPMIFCGREGILLFLLLFGITVLALIVPTRAVDMFQVIAQALKTMLLSHQRTPRPEPSQTRILDIR